MVEGELKSALKRHFGFDAFKPAQERVINSIMSGKDTLAIMPTGGGKSLCYQLPALVLDGVTLVVSPLIALMKDQVDALRARGINCACINSAQPYEEQKNVLNTLSSGGLKLLYVAPERFRSDWFVRTLRAAKIAFIAIDEAHCISQWGHDFRPDYMRLDSAIEKLGNPQRAAFTATATPDVKNDILAQLKMRSPQVFISGFERANLAINISVVSGNAEKLQRIHALARDFKTGIIYCATRKSVEKLSESLSGSGLNFVVYHAGLSAAERDFNQEKFISKLADIAIATNAFGMGIDRDDIRFVCHYEIPGSVEAYYQEAGRAGRDGNASKCEMLFSYADKRVQEFFIEGANPELKTIRAVYHILRKNAGEDGVCTMGIENISNALEKEGIAKKSANMMSVSASISLLRSHGYIERFDIKGVRTRATRIMDSDISPRDISFPEGLLEEKRKRDEARLKDVLRFAYSRGCRQKWILEYFGQTDYCSCGVCDECVKRLSEPQSQALTEEEILVVRKALSGIARMSYKTSDPLVWRPRFGREKILLSLVGSKDAKISASGLDRLSTFGILKPYGKKFVHELISRLIDASLAEVSQGDYPLLALTQLGAKAMLNLPAQYSLAFPKELCKSPVGVGLSASCKGACSPRTGRGGRKNSAAETFNPESLSEDDKALYAKLSAHRKRVAAARRVPPFRVFSNATLALMALQKPNSEREALEISGIGQVKAKAFLSGFLKIIKEK